MDRFLHALATGSRLYDYATLESYVEEDLRLIDRVQPDLVVGDFRLSLCISAREAGVPYFGIANAYWSPYADQRAPLPEHPMTRLLGVAASSTLFQLAQPAIFAYHMQPINRLRKHHGMSPFAGLRQVYTQGDHALYADVPDLVPTSDRPSNHHYIGPIL